MHSSCLDSFSVEQGCHPGQAYSKTERTTEQWAWTISSDITRQWIRVLVKTYPTFNSWLPNWCFHQLGSHWYCRAKFATLRAMRCWNTSDVLTVWSYCILSLAVSSFRGWCFRRRGAVITVSSGSCHLPTPQTTVYAATKVCYVSFIAHLMFICAYKTWGMQVWLNCRLEF